MTDQVVNIVAGYFEEIRHRPVVQKLYYKKSRGGKSDIDLLVVQDKPILIEEKSTHPYVKFDDITTADLKFIQNKLRVVLEKWSGEELQKEWKEHFKAELKEFFPQIRNRGYIISALFMCFDRFHNPLDVETSQAKAICNYVPNYGYPESEKWFVTSDKYPENLKELFKTDFRSPCGKTRLIDELFNTNEILEMAKEKIRLRISNKTIPNYAFNNIGMEVLRQQVIAEPH